VKIRLLILVILLSTRCFSQLGGSGVYSFLDLPIPARTAALGGNTIHIKDEDVSLLFQNPALLNKGMSNSVSFNYIRHFAGINHMYAAYARTFEKAGNFAVGIQNLSYGKFSERDEYGIEQGTFKANDYSFNISYSKQKDSLFSYGITLKTIYSNYYHYTSIGSAIDAGVTYHKARKQFTASVVVSNFGKQWKSYSGNAKEKIIPNFQIGISKKVLKAPFRVMLAYEYLNIWNLTIPDIDGQATTDLFSKETVKKSPAKIWADKFFRHITVATEIIITKNFNLRLGFDYRKRKEMALPDKQGISGFSFGFGFKISKFHLSYAYTHYHVAGRSNNISITTNLSSFVKQTEVVKPAE